MSDWLRWPRLWYATPTFVLFIALQAPHWRFTGRVYVALLVWSLMGVTIDVWMTRHQRQPGVASRRQDVRLLNNGGVIFGFILGLSAFWFRPVPDSVGYIASATALNAALEQLGILLPALDIFHHELLESGQYDYAAYVGSFFVVVVATWLPGFFLLYLAMVRLSPAEFASTFAAKKSYGTGPYGDRQQKLALKGLRLAAAFVPVMLLLFGRVLPTDLSHPAQSGLDEGKTYILLGWAGWVVNIFIYGFHSCRRFLSTLQPAGLLPTAESDHV
jgi:hypothetical protein